jgi:hypothetical protein
MRNILIGIIIFVIIYIFLFLRKTKRAKGPEKISRCIEILGLKPNASRLQKKAEEKLKEINAAYEYIKSFYCKT